MEEIAPETLSAWGRRVRDLQAWGWSHAMLARELGTYKASFYLMVTNPNYEPQYSLGRRFVRLYLRQARQRRRERQENQPA